MTDSLLPDVSSWSVGFTGTQKGMTFPQMLRVAREIKGMPVDTAFHHGMCVGADEQFHRIVERFGPRRSRIVGHPGYPKKDPSDRSRRAKVECDLVVEPKPFMSRNDDIVFMANVVFATPGEGKEKLYSGTWATVRRTVKAGKLLFLVAPNGRDRNTIKEEA